MSLTVRLPSAFRAGALSEPTFAEADSVESTPRADLVDLSIDVSTTGVAEEDVFAAALPRLARFLLLQRLRNSL